MDEVDFQQRVLMAAFAEEIRHEADDLTRCRDLARRLYADGWPPRLIDAAWREYWGGPFYEPDSP